MLHIPRGRGAFYIGSTLCVAIAITWLVMILMPYGWQENSDIFYTFQISLYSLGTMRNDHALKEDQHHPETKLSGVFSTLEGRDAIWLSVAKWAFCHEHVSDEWCDYIHKLQLTSTTVVLTGLLGVGCLLMGVMAGFYFHFVKPREDLYKWAAAYLVIAPLAFTYGIADYWSSTSEFSILIGESDSSFGFAFYTAAVASGLSWIASWVMLSFAFGHPWEDAEEEDGLWKEDEDGYGSMIQGVQESVVTTALRITSTIG